MLSRRIKYLAVVCKGEASYDSNVTIQVSGTIFSFEPISGSVHGCTDLTIQGEGTCWALMSSKFPRGRHELRKCCIYFLLQWKNLFELDFYLKIYISTALQLFN